MAESRAHYERNVRSFFDRADQSNSFETSHCIFCGEGAVHLEIFSKGSMRVCRCKCGFVFNSNQPTQRSLEEFYRESEAMTDWSKIKSSPEESPRQAEKFSHVVTYLTDMSHVRSVMDVGCGTGMFLQMLKAAKPALEVYGCDSNASSVAVARSNGLEVDQISIETALEYPKNYDCISMWGVLEHVKNPIGILKMAEARLNPHGYLVLCVPNVESAIVRAIWDKCFTFCPQHLWYFSESTLIRALDKAGLTLQHAYTIEPEGLPLMKAMNGLNPYGDQIPIWDPAYATLPFFEKQLLNNKKGYKIVALARKSNNQMGIAA